MTMLHSKKDLIARIEDFDDTSFLVEKLYEISHDCSIEDMPTEVRYFLMEAVTNLNGLYDLCRQLAHHLNVEAFNAQKEKGDSAADREQGSAS